MPDSRLPPRAGGAAFIEPWRWHLLADRKLLQQEALRRILALATTAEQERGRFLIVLAGGETPRGLYQQLRTLATNWSTWHIYFSDERCLPADDAARNSRMAGAAWLDHVPIPVQQIHSIPAQFGASAAAEAYAATLRDVGDFDLVLLGLGEDGHTASLFAEPDGTLATVTADTIAVFNAPKPPPQRVSLSAVRLGRTRQLLFLIEGEGKRNAVTDWRAGKDIPARHILPASGVDVLWAPGQ